MQSIMKSHPGGSYVLKKFRNKNAAVMIENKLNHVDMSKVLQQLEKCFVAKLKAMRKIS